MRAAFITGPGPAGSIVVGELPDPGPGPTDVLVRVRACAVNQVDTYIRAGRYPVPMPVPFVVGRDLVGTVEAAGPGTGFVTGERVWCDSLGHGGRQGACAQLAVVPAERLYRLPPEVDDDPSVVAVFHPAATAFLGLHRRADVRAGQTILVGGAAGSIGGCVVTLAREAGLRVIATARPDDHAYVRRLGAHEVLDYAAPDLTDQILATAPGGVDVHWDTSGHGRLVEAARVVAPGARIVVTAGRDPQPEVSLWSLYTRDVSVRGFVISLATAAELAEAAAAINRRLAGPGLPARVARVLPLAETALAHSLVEAGARGRVVVTVG